MTILIAIIANVLLSFLVAHIGRGRAIGYNNSLAISLLYSAFIGLFVVLVSREVEHEQELYYEQPLELEGGSAEEKYPYAARYGKLLSLRSSGMISDTEFLEGKNKIKEDWEQRLQNN